MLEYVRDEFKKVTASVNESKRHLDQKKDLVNFLMQNQIFGMPVSKDALILGTGETCFIMFMLFCTEK